MDVDAYRDIPEMHPMYGLVGLLVSRCGSLETWLYICASNLSEGETSYYDFEADKPKKVFTTLRTLVQRLSDPDRSQLQSYLDEAADIFDLRNAIVHGILNPLEGEAVWQSQRPARTTPAKRREIMAAGQGPWPYEYREFTPDEVLERANKAREISGFIMGRDSAWREELNHFDPAEYGDLDEDG